ncbi:toll/interleukin-1 receptor domain-containing protein [Pedobacter heparinus]|uniref:toll/interleukin-1 receptor domain-containing protein n=1 Tax=Pedobacter heparinus TaxID=984 RepID=UPI002931829B|nr:toll/interleukin-1 receptor domain-containing protein [Pedobacter heparinus]
MKVFISHSSDDKRFVRTLKTDLNENGIHTWFDEDELSFGDTLVEKLEQSIDQTSHFIIILSESSINSPWVQKELKHVLANLNRKIIPIKYKECELPAELDLMLFGDVSAIARISEGDKLVFSSSEYLGFIKKLIKSLRSVETRLENADRKLLAKMDEVKDSEKETDKKYFSFKIKGYTNTASREAHSKHIKMELARKNLRAASTEINKPIILPKALLAVFGKINLGDRVMIKNIDGEERIGLFGGYRTSDDTLILPASIRNYLSIDRDKPIHDVMISSFPYEIMIL